MYACLFPGSSDINNGLPGECSNYSYYNHVEYKDIPCSVVCPPLKNSSNQRDFCNKNCPGELRKIIIVGL